VANDPACNLDPNASFVKPAGMGDLNVNFVGQDTIATDIPLETDDIKAESDYILPDQTNTNNSNVPQPTSNTPTNTRKPNANKEAQKPKAILPKKKG
jgi:hypothetical protein